MTENPDCVENLCIESPIGPSDHAVISYDYMCHIDKNNDDWEYRRSYYNGNYDQIREEMGEVDWDKELEHKNRQDSWSFIQNKINGLIEKHIPMKKYMTTGKHPWFNRNLNILHKSKKKGLE